MMGNGSRIRGKVTELAFRHGARSSHASRKGAGGRREDKNRAGVRITTDYERNRVLDGTYTAFSVSVNA